MVKTVFQYLFSSSRNKEANIGEHLKKGFNFEQRERKYANTWGDDGLARGQKSLTPKSLLFYSFCIYNNLFPLRFHFYVPLKLQLNCKFTILPFSGP